MITNCEYLENYQKNVCDEVCFSKVASLLYTDLNSVIKDHSIII